MPHTQLSSPQLVALHRRLRTHGLTALDTFWVKVCEQGTPLIEPIADDDRHTLVTFLWRGADVHNVVAVSPAWPSVPRDNRLGRLRDTDLWHKTYLLPSDLHFTYRLSVNDPLAGARTLTPQQVANRLSVGQTDPLNARTLATQVGATSWTSSLACLPKCAGTALECATASDTPRCGGRIQPA